MTQPSDIQLELIRAASGALEMTDDPFVRIATSGPGEPTTLIVFATIVDNSDVDMATKLLESATNAIARSMKPMTNVRPPKGEKH